MKKFLRHPITQMCIGWLFVLTVWLVLPADPPYVDQAAAHRSQT
ncbi:hypothetical protein [Burkholderia multivorans]|jgi:hypothetical protein|nr:hypothetical protein [Burkholderia multivorans]